MAKHAWMHLTQDHLPEMKGLKLGQRYKVEAEIEPHELATGENEYGGDMIAGPGQKPQKPPMRGRFKVHSIKISSKGGSVAQAPKSPAKGGAKGKKAGRYS